VGPLGTPGKGKKGGASAPRNSSLPASKTPPGRRPGTRSAAGTPPQVRGAGAQGDWQTRGTPASMLAARGICTCQHVECLLLLRPGKHTEWGRTV
jgi:hypothetical protein